MEEKIDSVSPPKKLIWIKMYFDLCFICQNDTEKNLVEKFLFERFLLSQRALFDRDGLFLPKTYKGKLMKIPEALPVAGLEPENMNENEL